LGNSLSEAVSFLHECAFSAHHTIRVRLHAAQGACLYWSCRFENQNQAGVIMSESEKRLPPGAPVPDATSWGCVDITIDGPGDRTIRPSTGIVREIGMREREKIARWQAWRKQKETQEQRSNGAGNEPGASAPGE
jgi:hypothetical protein